MTDQNQESNEFEMIEELSPRTRPQPYATDPDYQELLRQYQNGDWAACGTLIENLLSDYPDDPGLLEFQAEVGVKQSLQKTNVITAKEDRRNAFMKYGLWLVVGVVGIAIIAAGMIFGINAYQDRVESARATQQAETLLLSLTTKLQNANDFLQSGRPTSAMQVLEQIQEIDPEFGALG